MLTPLPRLPVYDSVPVQEHQGGRDLGRVETRPRLVELPRALDLEHEVASVDVLHHEEQAVLERERERGGEREREGVSTWHMISDERIVYLLFLQLFKKVYISIYRTVSEN